MSHESFQVMSARVAMGASLKRFCIFATLPRPTALGAELPRLPINATIYEKSFNESGNADVRLCTENRGRAESQNLSQNGYGWLHDDPNDTNGEYDDDAHAEDANDDGDAVYDDENSEECKWNLLPIRFSVSEFSVSEFSVRG